jgi:hypothetical protein
MGVMLFRKLVLLLSVVTLAACGNNSPVIDSPIGPGANATTVYTETLNMDAAANIQSPATISRDVTVQGAGQVDVQVDWQITTNDYDIIVTDQACANYALAYNGKCTILGRDAGQGSSLKPADAQFKITATTPMRIFVYNFGTKPDTGPLTVFLTPPTS